MKKIKTKRLKKLLKLRCRIKFIEYKVLLFLKCYFKSMILAYLFLLEIKLASTNIILP